MRRHARPSPKPSPRDGRSHGGKDNGQTGKNNNSKSQGGKNNNGQSQGGKSNNDQSQESTNNYGQKVVMESGEEEDRSTMVKLLSLTTKNNSLEVKVESLEKELNRLRKLVVDSEAKKKPDSDSEEEVHKISAAEVLAQLKATHSEEVHRLKSIIDEKDEEIIDLNIKVKDMIESQYMKWNAGERLTPGEDVKDDDPRYWGVYVQDLIELRDNTQPDMKEYCDAHALCCDGFQHVCRESPCRFSHFGIDVLKNEEVSDEKWNDPDTIQDLVGNMHLLVQRYMKPTLFGKDSWATMCNRHHGRRPVKVTTFVSHSWAEPFDKFVETLETALDPREAVFVCTFALDQHADIKEKLSSDVCDSPFARALYSSNQVLIVVDPEITMPTRLWCAFECCLARQMRKTLKMWPHTMLSSRLEDVEHAVNDLDVSQADATDPDDRQRIKDFIVTKGGGFDRLTEYFQETLRDRLKFFKRAVSQLHAEYTGDGKDLNATFKQNKLLKVRLREVQSALEFEAARKVSLNDALHSGHEFAKVTGPFFPSSDVVEQVFDTTFKCMVSRVRGTNGLHRLKCRSALELGFGTWKVGFVVKRVLPSEGCALFRDYGFHNEIALYVNNELAKTVSLDDVFQQGKSWQLLEFASLEIPSIGLGELTQEVLEGWFKHPSVECNKEIEITVTLFWGPGKRELQDGFAIYLDERRPVRVEIDATFMIITIEDSLKLELDGKISRLKFHGDDEFGGIDYEPLPAPVLKGEVRKAGGRGGVFELTIVEEHLKCHVDLAMEGSVNGVSLDMRAESASPLPTPKSTTKLPPLQTSPMQWSLSQKTLPSNGDLLSSSFYRSQAMLSRQSRRKPDLCAVKKCLCKTRPHTEFGFFIDRCYAERQSDWYPNYEGGLSNSARSGS